MDLSSESSLEYEFEEPSQSIDGTKFKYRFTITNIPESWSRTDKKKFIIDTVNSKHVSQNMCFSFFKRTSGKNTPNELLLKFSDKEAAEEAYEILKEAEVNGKKLSPKKLPKYRSKEVAEPTAEINKPNAFNIEKGKKLDITPTFYKGQFAEETYGLNIDFLKQLGISPPLTPSIFVGNLPIKVDEKKLQEVFSLAGQIKNISLMRDSDGVSKCKAIILYDHPVEAVQAISMFNRQTLYDNRLFVCKDTKSNISTKIVPSGLSSFGLGLGENGDPLQYTRVHLGLEEIKQIIRDWMNNVNKQSQSSNVNNNQNASTQEEWQSDLFKSLSVNMNPMSFGNSANSNPGVNTSIETLLQGLLQQMSSVNVLAQNPLQSVLLALLSSGLSNLSSNQTLTERRTDPVDNSSKPKVPGGKTFKKSNVTKAKYPVQASNIKKRDSFATNFDAVNVNISTGPTQQPPRRCYTCRQLGHVSTDCPQKCNTCRRPNHTAIACRFANASRSSR